MGKVKILNGIINSAKLFIFQKKPELMFLVVKEPEGMWGFPGGAQDEEDRTIKDTAVRELNEEVGLTALSTNITDTGITHEFVHSDPLSPRYKLKGKLHAFLGEYNRKERIQLSKDTLEEPPIEFKWMTEDEVKAVLKSSYPYLLDTFQKLLSYVRNIKK